MGGTPQLLTSERPAPVRSEAEWETDLISDQTVASQLSSRENLTEAQQQLIRRCAMISAQCELMEQETVQGKPLNAIACGTVDGSSDQDAERARPQMRAGLMGRLSLTRGVGQKRGSQVLRRRDVVLWRRRADPDAAGKPRPIPRASRQCWRGNRGPRCRMLCMFVALARRERARRLGRGERDAERCNQVEEGFGHGPLLPSANARAAVQMRRCKPFHNWEARACR